MAIKTIFLDRDGVINKEVNYLHRVEDFEFIHGLFDACRYLQKLGYSLVIVTNQSGIGRGIYKLVDYQILTEWMINEFKRNSIEILDIFYCPHSPKSKCSCRKPSPGMLINAQIKHDINMKGSWMIGDKESDIQAASMAGLINTILVRSGHQIDESTSSAMFFLDSINEIKKTILK